jgi:hypothetical protein
MTARYEKSLTVIGTYKRLLRIAAGMTGVHTHQIRNHSRQAKTCRQAAMLATRILTGASLQQIAYAAQCENSTVCRAIRNPSLDLRRLADEIIERAEREANELPAEAPAERPAPAPLPTEIKPVRGCPMCAMERSACRYHACMQRQPRYFAQQTADMSGES